MNQSEALTKPGLAPSKSINTVTKRKPARCLPRFLGRVGIAKIESADLSS